MSGSRVPRVGLLILAAIGLLAASLAFAAPARAAGFEGHWVWPLSGPIQVIRGFEPPTSTYGSGHHGVDLAASVGQQVRTAGSGIVTFADDIAGVPMVTVRHGDLRTTYQPVAPTVHVGQVLIAGESIGTITIAPAHCGLLPPCLHWGLIRGSTYLDPLTLVGASHVRLLPHLSLAPAISGVETLARGSNSPTRALSSTAPANSAPPAQSGSTSHVLLASAGVTTGAGLALGTAARLRRRRVLAR